MNVVLAKLAICALCLLVLWVAFNQKKRIEQLGETTPVYHWISLLWIAFRLIPFLLVFIILGIEPTSDVNGFWYMATHAAEGKLVYRDFWSPYSPLYSYVLAIGALFWYNPKVIVLIMIVIEGLTVWLAYYFYQPVVSKPNFFFRSLVYFVLPGSIILCVLGAQEDIWMWLFFSLAFYIRRKSGNVLFYSLILALGVLTSKAIFVLFLLPLFILEKDKFRFAAPLAITGLLSLLLLYTSVGTEFLQPVGEADTLRAPNIVSVINPWLYNSIGMGESFWNWTGLVITILIASIAALKWKHQNFEITSSRLFLIMYATLMIVQQSAYSNYIFIFLLPFVLVLTDFRDKRFVVFLFVYNVLCAVHPSIWWRAGMPKYYSPSDIFKDFTSVVDYSLQAGIVILTVYLIIHTLKYGGKNTESSRR